MKNNIKSLVILNVMKDLYQVPQLDFDILLAFSIGKPKEFLYIHPEYPISIIQYLRFRWFINRYKKGYSVAAITKHKEFYGLDFYVNKNVLIPRPDTERLVASATRIMNDELRIKNDKVILIDVGTGSGCIPISILKNLIEPITTYSTDISRSALRVAKKNAVKHNVKINFLHGNLLEPLIHHSSFILPTSTLVVTANLPYLTEKQFRDEPSIQREPKHALVADKNGLALYEELLQQIKSLFLIHHSSSLILFEIDPSQTEEISKIIKQYLPNSTIEIKKDLSGLDRLIKIF